jgi:hypothetical protein
MKTKNKPLWRVVWTGCSPEEFTDNLEFDTKEKAQVYKAEHQLGKYASVVKVLDNAN